MNNALSRFKIMRMNKNLIDRYNKEQEGVKNDLYAYFLTKSYSYDQFSRILGVTQQSLLNIFRGGRMTPKVEQRMRDWIEVHFPKKDGNENRG